MIPNLLFLLYVVTILLCLTSYLFYPMILYLVAKFHRITIKKAEILPPVSIVISAYNEGKYIEDKINNTLSLDYPKDKLEILIGSDGSTDDTATRISKYHPTKVRFFNFEKNRGKTTVQNDLIREAKHDILIFTDAACFIAEGVIKKIVRNFADERVGCVAGKMNFIHTENNITTQSQGIYWHYESKIRELESTIGNLIGVDGPLYAVKKSYYVYLQPNIISDLITPLLVLAQGKRTILEPEAIVSEEPKVEYNQEFETRRRITLRGMVSVFKYPELLNPLRYPLMASQILFHKLIRWSVGYIVLLNVIACIGLIFYDALYRIILVFYAIFFITAVLGWLASVLGIKSRILSIPFYFCLVNLAASLGILDFLRGKQAITWKTVR